MAHLQHRLGDVDLVFVQVTRQTFKVAQHLETGHTQPAVLDLLHRSLPAIGVLNKIPCQQHHLRKTSIANRIQLALERTCQRDGVHPEIVNIAFELAHDGLAPFVMNEFEHHATHHGPG